MSDPDGATTELLVLVGPSVGSLDGWFVGWLVGRLEDSFISNATGTKSQPFRATQSHTHVLLPKSQSPALRNQSNGQWFVLSHIYKAHLVDHYELNNGLSISEG